jgi:hypothetical protein
MCLNVTSETMTVRQITATTKKDSFTT